MKDLNPSQLKSLQHTAMLNREFHPCGRIIVAAPRPKEPEKRPGLLKRFLGLK